MTRAMTKKPLPYKLDYKHWKELHEMEQQKHAQTKEEARREIYRWQQHAITLTDALHVLLSSNR